MFTGIVEEMGKISSVRKRGEGRELTIRAGDTLNGLKVGDSIAVDGCCQTVVKRNRDSFSVVAVEETLRKTTFGNYVREQSVNLELPMRADSRLGGHFVLGHVDCTTRVTKIVGVDTGRLISFALPKKFVHLVIPVGSIAVNGVSLTVARLSKGSFTIAIIPHTWEATTFHALQLGTRVNLEFDMLGKYVERLVKGRRRAR